MVPQSSPMETTSPSRGKERDASHVSSSTPEQVTDNVSVRISADLSAKVEATKAVDRLRVRVEATEDGLSKEQITDDRSRHEVTD